MSEPVYGTPGDPFWVEVFFGGEGVGTCFTIGAGRSKVKILLNDLPDPIIDALVELRP